MRTPVEALFDAMITAGWADESDGGVEAPTGHFAMFSLGSRDMSDVHREFSDITDLYGVPDSDAITGNVLVITECVRWKPPALAVGRKAPPWTGSNTALSSGR